MKNLLLFIFVAMLVSCRIERKIYSPLPVNNPSLRDKNDFSVNASISAPGAFDINGGVALTNRLAIIAGGYLHGNKDMETHSGFSNIYDSSRLVYRHKGFTLGTGVYIPLVRQRSSTYFSFYGGINKGNFKMNEELHQISPNPSVARYNYKSSLNRYFLQGSINFYSNDVEGSLTTRYNIAEFKNVITDYSNNQLSDFRLPPFVTRRISSFIDFGYDVKIFFSPNRWGIQLFGLISTRTNNEEYPGKTFYYYYRFRTGTGIFFRGILRRTGGN